MGRDDESEEGSMLDFVDFLVQQDLLKGAALGVAKKVIVDRGVESLSDKQRHVFEKHVIKAHRIEHCNRCSAPIPWSEMTEAMDNGGNCGYCAHMKEKIMSE